MHECECVYLVFSTLSEPNVPTWIVKTVNIDLVGTFFLVPMRKQAYESYRMKCLLLSVCIIDTMFLL